MNQPTRTPEAPRRPRRVRRAVLAGVLAVALPVAIVLGRYWQDRIRELMGVATDPPAASLLVLPVAAVVPFVALVAADGPFWRALTEALAQTGRRSFVPHRLERALMRSGAGGDAFIRASISPVSRS